jgi:hypothetical protein
MGCFHASRLSDLRMKPINQLWRDHMLAGSMLLADGWKEGMFVVLYPAANSHAAAAIQRYQGCLADGSTFATWTIESFVAALEAENAGVWVDELKSRYLASELRRGAISSDDGRLK